MAVLRSEEYSREEMESTNARARQRLKELGVIISDAGRCIGMPWICYEDFTKEGGEAFDLEPFRGRIVLNGDLDSSDFCRYPGGPVRLSILRWGTEPDQLGKIVVGKSDLNNTSILSMVSIVIGDNVHLDPRVVIQDTDAHPADRRLPDIVENKKRAPIVIEDDVWIGYGSTVLKGVTVGRGAVVLPGSVVMFDVPAGAVFSGNPAKNVKIFQAGAKARSTHSGDTRD